ncbi:MAG: redoxin family protein [Saprospiraceae bacterium]|jgi:thiol-disulfide isomerase/thioredoxin|uniref:Redoxin family protein n=1 Tax=Candidatus Defluviibacterium haderslevense TaxID=2981993 RepID=A0A9D7SAI4_9BACT|nr:redoxin family protein [Candidatus Defluviibacterium haderslevense]MBK9717891.1 redoxin family protein [Candidatus Defluviibacterium haderslevense]MBL0236736.1 redoxin family protein [Candidatus Defluviibacterium haderslevense]
MKFIIKILITISLLSCNKKHDKNSVGTLDNVYDLSCNLDLPVEFKQNKNHLLSLDSTFLNHGLITENIRNIYKNKIFYVDIWFVGCPGCKYQEPYFKTLYNKFINKNISFISFCLYSDREEAENYIAKNKIPGDHYLLNIKQTKQFEKIYEISSYPTYLIFDKFKKLQYGDAPRPNSEGIEKLLQTLIK